MVGRRLLIYILSLALVVGAFLWLKSRFFALGAAPGGHRLKPIKIPSGTGGSNLVMVDRDKNGRLLYVLKFHRAIPKGSGRYHLVKPRMKFYGSHHTTIFVTSDYGDVSVDQLGGPLSNHIYPRKGRLYGHVVITIGPENSFIRGDDHRQKGQFQITLSRPVNFNYQEGLITSRGRVVVHGDRVAFAGRRLTCELNVTTKRLDYLQVAHGDYLTLKNINAATTASTSTRASGSAPRAVPKTQAPSTSQPGGDHKSKLVEKGHAAGKNRQSKASPAPATHPAAPGLSGSVYGMVFTEKVRVTFGAERLAAHRLRLYFSSARSNSGVAGKTQSPQTQPMTPSTTTQPATGKTGRPATHPKGHPSNPAPAANTGRNLVVHWSGPLILRPVRERHVGLRNVQDVILQAFGRSGDPVVMHDGPARLAYASEVRYHTATRRLRMQADGLAPIKFIDAHLGHITCRSLLYAANSNRLNLTGPGQWTYTPKGSASHGWQGGWQNQMQVVMRRSGRRGKSSIKSLRLSGRAVFFNKTFHLQSHTMHALFAAAPNGGAVLRRFIAHGHVQMRSALGTPARKARHDDTLTADTVRLSTAVNRTTGVRQPSSLYAAGGVHLSFYQTGGGAGLGLSVGAVRRTAPVGKSPRRYDLQSDFLRAQLQNISSATPAGGKHPIATGAPGRFTVGRFHAWGRVSLVISGASQPITATCSDLRGDRRTKLATLRGNVASDRPARIAEQDNWLSSQLITLNGESDDLNVPVAGKLYLTNRGGKSPTHLLLAWKGRMYFRNKVGEATFFSHVTAQLVGQPLRKSRLTAPVLQVTLRGRQKGALRVSEIYAFTTRRNQSVQAEDVSYNAAKLIDTRLFIECHRLRYNARKTHLLIAGHGKLSLENYRRSVHSAATTSAPTSRGQSAFAWSKSLDYRGSTGRLILAGKVRLVYRPMRPFVLSRSITGAYHGPNKGLILLDAARLIATLRRTDKTTSGAVALGMGGPAKLKSVRADRAALELYGARLTADVLSFEAHKQIATAYSAAGRDAHITTPNGKLNAAAKEIIWRLGRSSQTAITLIQPRAGGSMP